MERNSTASAKHGHATREQGGESLRKGLARQGGEPPRHSKATHSDGSVKQCGAWHGEEMPLRQAAIAVFGAQTQRTTNYPFSRGAGLKSALRRAMREDGRMSITDELREWAHGFNGPWKRNEEMLLAIADRIDAEHERAIKSVMNDALYHANDKDMADLGWIRLPKDADGEPIHMGDLVTVPWKDKVYEVAGFSCSKQLCSGIRTIWIDVYSPEKQRNVPLCGADSCRHYHAPTVEDVLTEFAAKLIERGELTNGAAQTIAEYAKRLRLAGDAE